MSQYVTKIKTSSGGLQIDYNALANLPKTDTTLSQSGQAADAKVVGEALAEKLSSAALDDAIDTALAEAKAGGEFDGKDGASVTHSWNGTTLSITSASGTTSADLRGEPGYSPVCGTDYWTAADKAEIKAYVDEAILGGAW